MLELGIKLFKRSYKRFLRFVEKNKSNEYLYLSIKYSPGWVPALIATWFFWNKHYITGFLIYIGMYVFIYNEEDYAHYAGLVFLFVGLFFALITHNWFKMIFYFGLYAGCYVMYFMSIMA